MLKFTVTEKQRESKKINSLERKIHEIGVIDL